MKVIVDKKLATSGLGGKKIKSRLPFKIKGRVYVNDIVWHTLDVRDLSDGGTEGCNEDLAYEKKIDKAISYLKKKKSILLCCAAGKSRSNAIALGILIKYYGMTYGKALEFVNDKANAKIRQPHLNAIKRIC